MATTTNASLYVGDLKPDVTESLLFKIFNAVGPVASIRVCRDAVTRQSLGYAYVNFHNVGDAERALDTMNYTNIRSKPCRIMWSCRNPSLRKSGVGNIFVKNLDKSIDNKTLYDTFSMFGDILSCKVAKDKNSTSLGYGFVHYQTEEAAKKAIEKVNKMVIADKQVYVAPFKSKKDRGVVKRVFTNVYFKNFPSHWGREDLENLAKDYGETNSAYLSSVDVENTSSLGGSTPSGPVGFGFVNFADPEDAEKCVKALHEKEYEGIKLYVQRAQSKKEREQELKNMREKQKAERQKKYEGVNLYVKNLHDSFDDDKLRKLFEQFGTITSAKVMLDPSTNKSRGFGFVCFQTKDEANRAMSDMNSKIVETKPLYVGLAQRKEARRAALEQQARRRAQKASSASRNKGTAAMQNRGYGYGGNTNMGMPPRQNLNMVRPTGMMGGGGQAPWFAGNQRATGQWGHMMGGQRGVMAHAARGRGGVPNMGPYAMDDYGKRNMVVGAGRGRGIPPTNLPASISNAVTSGNVSTHAKLDASSLANADPTQQKQMIGEKLFPLIQSVEPRLAGKITGMLLEMDNTELLHLIESRDALMSKINEALHVLKQYNDVSTVAME